MLLGWANEQPHSMCTGICSTVLVPDQKETCRLQFVHAKRILDQTIPEDHVFGKVEAL